MRSSEVVPPEQLRLLFLRPRPQTAIEFDPIEHRRDPAPVRRVRPAGRRDRRPRRSGASCRPATRASSATRSSIRPADVAAIAAAFRPAFGHLALLRQIPGVDIEARIEAEKGAPLTAIERLTLDRADRPRPTPGWRPSPPTRPGSPSGTTGCPMRPPASIPSSAPGWPALAGATAASVPGLGRRLAGRSSSRPRRKPDCPPGGPSARCTWPSSAGPTDRAPAGCWPASSRPS